MLFLVFFFFLKKRTLKRGFRMFFKEIIVWIDALTMVRGMDSWIGSYYEIALLSLKLLLLIFFLNNNNNNKLSNY
jgi:hypothetical protein